MSPSPANYFVRANYLACVVFALLSGRAIRRWVATRRVLPPELVGERHVAGFVVTLFGAAGHFFFFITMSAAIGIALAKKIVGPLVVGMLAYLIALPCGEHALAGDGVSDASRAARSGPIC